MKRISISFGIIIVLLLCLTFLSGIISRNRIRIPDSFPGQYVNIDGIKIRYVQNGHGRDILLIHGSPGSLEDWAPLMAGLSRNFRVTAYDRPGQGFSDPGSEEVSIHSNAEIALALITKLKLKNPIVVGHGYGGSILLALANIAPPGIRSYVMIAGISRPTGPLVKGDKWFALPLLGDGLTALGTVTVGSEILRNLVNNRFFPDKQLVTNDYLQSRKKIWLQTKVLNTTAQESRNLSFDLEQLIPEYDELKGSFTIIQGTADRLASVDGSIELHERMRHSDLLILENIGHEVQFARPDLVVRAIRKQALKN